MQRVWDKKGKSFLVHSVDARELVQQGDHTTYDPKVGKPEINVKGSLDKFPADQDLYKLSKDELIEFALEKFNAKLSVRFGEPRLISEIQKLQAEKDALIEPSNPVTYSEDQDLDELVDDELVEYAKQFFDVDLDVTIGESALREKISELQDAE